MKEPQNFMAPIPGQSLTGEPGGKPWERPPEIADPEEAINMHLSRLADPEKTEDILNMLELDISVVQLTEGILRSAVATGVHSIDVSLIVAPVVHEFIKGLADKAGITYEEGLEDKAANEKKKRAVNRAKIKKYLSEHLPEEVEAPEEEPEMDMEMPEEEEGFMKPREKMV